MCTRECFKKVQTAFSFWSYAIWNFLKNKLVKINPKLNSSLYDYLYKFSSRALFYEYHKREKCLLTWIDMGYGLHSFNSILCPGTNQYKERTYEDESGKDCWQLYSLKILTVKLDSYHGSNLVNATRPLQVGVISSGSTGN